MGRRDRPNVIPAHERKWLQADRQAHRHGKVLCESAVPGLPERCGLEIDRDDNPYTAAPGTRIFGGKLYYNDLTGTLMKFRPGRRQ